MPRYAYKAVNSDGEVIEGELEVRGGIDAHDAHAWVLYRLGRFDEARAASDRATRLGTKDALLLFHAGAIRLARGGDAGKEKGRALIEEALALNPGFDPAGACEARQIIAALEVTSRQWGTGF